MKILMINNFFSPSGGTESLMKTSADILTEKGHEVLFFSSDKKPYIYKDYKYSEYFSKYIDFNGLKGIDKLKYLSRPFYNTESEHNIRSLLKKIKPDIAHVHNIMYHLTPSVLKACIEEKIPVIMTLHDIRLICPSGTLMLNGKKYCHDELCINGNQLHCITNRCKNRNFAASVITAGEFMFNRTHKLYKKVDHIICPSQAVYELAARSGIDRAKMSVINNYLDDSYFEKPIEYNEGKYFLYTGRLVREKGVEDLIHAISKLPENIQLHIAGTGSQEEFLRNLAGKLGLDNVKFLGFISGKQLEEEYKNCKALLMPSNWFEVFGLTAIEAFSYGKPVIAANIGGITEIVEDKINGLFFKAGDSKEIAEKVDFIENNPDEAIRMGKNGRYKAERIYNSQIHYEKLLKVYENQLSA